MAEADRLAPLCRLGSVTNLAASVCPGAAVGFPSEFQRHLATVLIAELHACLRWFPPSGVAVLRWFLAGYQVENIKILLRSLHTGRPVAANSLYELPPDVAAELPLPEKPESPDDVFRSLADGPLGAGLAQTRPLWESGPRLFLQEVALDRAYLAGLLARLRPLPDFALAAVRPVLLQYADSFHLQLATRGRLIHGLGIPALLGFHIPGAAISRLRLTAMLGESTARGVAETALHRAVDTLPEAHADSATVEALARDRCLRMANRAFRQDPVGLGAVIGYAALRHIEIANLATVSEGIHAGVPEETIRLHLVPHPSHTTHV
jgi:vacuolar-type H+-ATPase subunit C/Vma6